MVPEVYLWRTSATALCLFLAAVLPFPSGLASSEEARSLTRVVYEFAVTSYCGTQDREVDRGFRAELAALTERGGFDEDSARRQRIRGWVEAEEEWRNRGLGGFRAWCLGEGLAAARHFQAIARGERQP
jgi:hypothetical protein